MSVVQLVLGRIVFARTYTLRLLDTIKPADWFRQPQGAVTFVAWQVGHLAVAEYRLALDRIRGRRDEDEALIDAAFVARYGRESVPDADPSRNPSPADIRRVFDRVHEQVLRELPGLPEEELAVPVTRPHPCFETKQDALFWCAHHEGVHAGQIGLLRRQLGQLPVW
jgi:hypothetical protein